MATYETAENRFISIENARIAYRTFGKASGVPLVLIVHFRGTMDHWDPALINPIAAQRPVILIDCSGVGRSSGEIPESISGFAQVHIDVINALGLGLVDVMGFSLGGTIAQMVALNAAGLVRRLILCGTIPSIGEGLEFADPAPFVKIKDSQTLEDQKESFISGFFSKSVQGQTIGNEVWERIVQSRPNRWDYVNNDGANQQAGAFARFMNPDEANNGSYDRLHELKMPVLIMSGSDDILMPTANSIFMWNKLKGAAASLHLYPDSGHGFLFQHATSVASQINMFLH